MAKFHSLKIQEIRKETKDAVSIVFEIPENLSEEYKFIQGQYLTLKSVINNEEVRRSYSVCVSPFDDELRVAVKKVKDGRFSTFANDVLQEGDHMDVMTPMGNFFSEVKSENKKNYVGFAGGSGITPVISILKTVLQVEEESTFILFYGNRGFDAIIFREELEGLKKQYEDRLTIHHIFSEEKLADDLFNGFIDKEKCKAFAEKLYNPNIIDEFFICGPEPMMIAISEALKTEDIPEKKIHLELFTSPVKSTEKPKEQGAFDSNAVAEVTVLVDDEPYEFSLNYGGNSILDTALEQGADLPFACKGGVCSTCRAKLVSGEIEMDANYSLEPEEVEAGFILTCQSHPRSEKIVVDFDQQ